MKVADLYSPDTKMVVARTKRGMVLKYPEGPQDFDALMKDLAAYRRKPKPQLIRRVQEESRSEYFKRLEDELKIRRLGNGAFARVFQHPTHPEVVVKVFTDEDQAYNKYLKFCQAHPDNKYLPKILSVHRHVNNPFKPDHDRTDDEIVDDRYTIVFMEKLEPSTMRAVTSFAEKLAGPDYLDLAADKKDDLFHLTLFRRPQWLALAKQKHDPDLAEFAKFFAATFTNSSASFPDLHDSNIMQRGSQLVFTDPTS